MDFIKGKNRNQLVFSTLEIQIEQDNLSSLCRCFCGALRSESTWFCGECFKNRRSSCFWIEIVFEVYLYRYLYEIRSSRRLEKEYIRNMELQCSYNHTNIKDRQKSKRKNCLDLDCLQHPSLHHHFRNTGIDQQNKKLDSGLLENSFFYFKHDFIKDF